jgi:hypothetical protein
MCRNVTAETAQVSPKATAEAPARVAPPKYTAPLATIPSVATNRQVQLMFLCKPCSIFRNKVKLRVLPKALPSATPVVDKAITLKAPRVPTAVTTPASRFVSKYFPATTAATPEAAPDVAARVCDILQS